ncbi:MAG TPA: ATP-binding cassette domain-containing protein [Spirochaetia bacterium]|nr:ATP-binding cassette domain-containing protein [Spirochaetia bacterium]
MGTELVRMENMTKTYGRVQAIKGIDLTVNVGEIVGLVGDNGAGKSTLIKILVGAIQANPGGRIFFKGNEVKIQRPIDAINLGIESIYQESSLVSTLSIPRNLFLGREPVRHFGPFAYMDTARMDAEAHALLKQIGIKRIDLNTPISNLSGGERQSIAIARAMYFEKDLIILDEPTNQLGIEEIQSVLEFVVKAKDKGYSTIFITHNIHHIYRVADRIVVLRSGQKVGDMKKTDTSIEQIEEIIIGKKLI